MLKEQLSEIKDILNTPEAAPVEEVTEEVPEAEEVVESQEGDVVSESDESTELVAESEEGGEPDTEGALEDTKSYSVAEFAKAVGWETADMYNDITVEMQGGDSIPLGQLKDKFQDLTTDNAALQTKLTEAENTQAGGVQAQNYSNDMIALMGNLSQIDRAEQGTNWAELEDLDPTEAILKRDKIRRARDEVQGAMNQLNQQEQAYSQQLAGEQRTKMVELIPEWKDNDVLNKEQGAIKSMGEVYGYSKQEMNDVNDARLMKMLNDFSKLRAKNETALKAVKRVRKAPTVLNSNRNVVKGDAQSKTDALIKRATGSGDKNLEHSAIKALLSGKV